MNFNIIQEVIIPIAKMKHGKSSRDGSHLFKTKETVRASITAFVSY